MSNVVTIQDQAPQDVSVELRTPPGPDAQWLANPESGAQHEPFRFLLNLVRDFGDNVRYSNVYGPVYFFNHPEQVREVLHSTNIVRSSLVSLVLGQGILASDGDYWRKQKRIMQPEFREGCIMGFGPIITDCIEKMFERWNLKGDEFTVDLALELKYLTLEVVAKAMFGTDLSAEAPSLCAAIGTIVGDLGSISNTFLNSSRTISPGRNERFREAVETVNTVVYDLLEKRRALAEKPRDLLTTLIESRDADTGEPLSDTQLRDELVNILIAGHETTAITLAWAWHLMLQNPETMQKLQEEVDGALEGRMPTLSDLPQLPYSGMVFNEAMRLYPPVWLFLRKAIEAEEIGGYHVPAQSFVIVSSYTTHRHPEFWDEPEEFRPERFTAGNAKDLPLYAHFPFAGGRHLCLGLRFAMIESQLIIASMAQRYQLVPVSLPTVVAEPALTLRHQFGVPMKVKRRL